MDLSLNKPSRQLARRHGEYGFDEPMWPLLFGLLGVICFVCAMLFLFNAASYVYTTRRGKLETSE